ncbi:MAG: M36 family metallopeptidase [Blastocatellia bacterium]|nr:M36 family metallopeptidase [Blastocatellia bacterium]
MLFRSQFRWGNRRLFRFGLWLLAVAVLVSTGSLLRGRAQETSGPSAGLMMEAALPDGETLRMTAAVQASEAEQPRQQAALERLHRSLPQAQVRWSPRTGTARYVYAETGTLTFGQSRQHPETTVRSFVAEHADLWNPSGARQATELTVVHSFQTPGTGLTHLRLDQSYAGAPIVGGGLKAAFLNGELLSVAGEIYAPEVSAGSVQAPHRIDASAAHRLALQACGLETVAELQVPLKSRFVWVPFSREILRPAWEVTLQPWGTPDVWRMYVDAERGEVLRKWNLTWYSAESRVQGSGFRIQGKQSSANSIPEVPVVTSMTNHTWEVANETPMAQVFSLTPQPNLPRTGGTPALTTRAARSLSGDPAASPAGWVDLARKTTEGNNVRALKSQTGSEQNGFQPVSETLDFSFPLVLRDPLQEPEKFESAAVTSAFYWTNFMHDYLYRLGFDEAAGNFQRDNFNLGGRGNDPVIVIVQDTTRINNAAFATSEDGASGRMNLYFWTRAVPKLDTSYDAEIICHEYTHGLTNRLVGGPADVTALNPLQSSGMGEGWSDWFALSILTKPEDDLRGAYPFGSYVSQNFERGLRRFAYSTDMTVNPLTYADIDPAQTRYPDDPTQIHKVGEVWCSALWEVRANFIARYGFEPGRVAIERLVLTALTLTPTGPSMIDGRDALLLADRALNQGANQTLIWRGFAKRGMGFSAEAFGGGLMTVRQAFDLPPFADDAGRVTFGAALVADGEMLTFSVGAAALAGAGTMNVVVTTTTGDEELLTVAETQNIPGLFQGAIPVRVGVAGAKNDGVVQAALGGDITVTHSGTGGTLTARIKAGKRVTLFEDAFETGAERWKPKAGWELTTRFAKSPTHSWTDSPKGDYPARANLILQGPGFNLSETIGAVLTFNHRFDIEKGFDFGLVEVKTGAGQPWQVVAAFSDTQPEFTSVQIPLSRFDGTKKLKIRFRLMSDAFNQRDGWYLDDVKVSGGSLK